MSKSQIIMGVVVALAVVVVLAVANSGVNLAALFPAEPIQPGH